MSATFVLNKDQIDASIMNGAIRERKILGYPHENAPLKSYSNIFYLAHISSDYGSIVSSHPHLGFEIFTYVIKGGIEVSEPNSDKTKKIMEGEVAIVQAGKGILHSEKYFPRTEIIQFWFDPDFKEFKKYDPQQVSYTLDKCPLNNSDDTRNTWNLVGTNSPFTLAAKDTNVHLDELSAGFHTFSCPEHTVLSGYILEGYVEIENQMLGKNDFFKIDNQNEVKVISLINSKIVTALTPYHPEYAIYDGLKAH